MPPFYKESISLKEEYNETQRKLQSMDAHIPRKVAEHERTMTNTKAHVDDEARNLPPQDIPANCRQHGCCHSTYFTLASVQVSDLPLLVSRFQMIRP